MISGSSMFSYLLGKYIIKEEVRTQLMNAITNYESDINTRMKIDDINISNYNVALETAIKHIEYADQILAWVQHLKLKIKMSKHILEKRLNTETILVTNEIENCQEIALLTTKTEKTSKKAFMLKEKLIKEQQDYDDAKIDYETIEVFVNECINAREARYAYYQAVKQIRLDIQQVN